VTTPEPMSDERVPQIDEAGKREAADGFLKDHTRRKSTTHWWQMRWAFLAGWRAGRAAIKEREE
jgi:hypothetical protein